VEIAMEGSGPMTARATDAKIVDAADMQRSNTAIMFAAEGYDTSRPKLMGRHAAGEGFLKGFGRHAGVDRFWALVPTEADGHHFTEAMRQITPGVPVSVATYARLDALKEPGSLFLPGPGVADHAWMRRAKCDQRDFSISGITHTTASFGAMDSIMGLVTGPVQRWDALICSSVAVRKTVDRVIEAQMDFFRDRLGASGKPALPELPVIPLGVDCDGFKPNGPARKAWRERLRIGERDLVLLFMGRLSFHAKAHPLPMYLAAEAAAKAIKGKVHLIQAGWFANDAIEQAFRSGAREFCPSVNAIFLDGRKKDVRAEIWAAADVFVSFSDNIQETFGLTPIEAMAAGLPCLVSDWDGYMDTVRDGEDGFRIRTWQAPAPLGEDLIYRQVTGADSYDRYCGNACQFVSVDPQDACEALVRLAKNRDLREKLGEQARRRARDTFDWKVVIGQYQQLWQALAKIRKDAKESAPRGKGPAWPARLDPFDAFAHYPTNVLAPDTKIAAVAGADVKRLDIMRRNPSSSYASSVFPERTDCMAVLAHLAKAEKATADELAALAPPERRNSLRRGLVWLAKHGLIQLLPFSDDR
jgi:glycosyltransferase involved in cell wall biosynthesis